MHSGLLHVSPHLLQVEMDYLVRTDQMEAQAHQVKLVHQVPEDLLVYQVTQQKENQDLAEQMEDLVLSDSQDLLEFTDPQA